MNSAETNKKFIAFSPRLKADDSLANYWLHQVTFRLRREICWRWQQLGVSAPNPLALPPLVDRLNESLDLSRYWDEKRHFFQSDPTAKYLSDQLSLSPPPLTSSVPRGSFSWLANALALDEVSQFVLSLGLIPAFDPAAGDVIAACQNDSSATYPTLALVQKLWDCPQHVTQVTDFTHSLWRLGVLQPVNDTSRGAIGCDWHAQFAVHPLVANRLLFNDCPLPDILVPLGKGPTRLPDHARMIALKLKGESAKSLRVLPILGRIGSDAAEIIRGICQVIEKEVVELSLDRSWIENDSNLRSLVNLCWLNDVTITMRDDSIHANHANAHPKHRLLNLRSLPVTLFLTVHERNEIKGIPNDLLLPMVEVPKMSYKERIQCWQKALGPASGRLQKSIAECARRFRYGKVTIDSIGSGLKSYNGQLTDTVLFGVCRAELDLDIGELAQPVIPRFSGDELVLPPKQQALFREILQAMNALTEVHYSWGTGKVWNESGISVLFAGPPGTGKTMAAEILAAKLDLPMYRIDLSQVVNKYIGETEKNLKRLFDTADISDMILFFDEADALFGRRTEVKDAHDRYANLEISYLLERMERFKGLAILATNRKKDLDEAFLRRLRYIIDFPQPSVPERKLIWQKVIPDAVDVSRLDFDLLAKQFALSGGHIRSIVFNACLRSANGSAQVKCDPPPRLTMEQVMVAVKREYDKLNRTVRSAQFAPYTELINGVEHGQDPH